MRFLLILFQQGPGAASAVIGTGTGHAAYAASAPTLLLQAGAGQFASSPATPTQVIDTTAAILHCIPCYSESHLGYGTTAAINF